MASETSALPASMSEHDIGLLMEAGNDALRGGQAVLARRAFAAILERAPDKTSARCGLGIAELLLGDIAAAERAFRRALSEEPESPATNAQMATVLRRRQQPGAAEAMLRRALRLAPDLVQVRVNLGNLLLSEGRASEACALLDEALRQQPGLVEAWHSLGDALARQGDFTGALTRYRRALKLRPAYAPGWTNAIALCLQTEQPGEALAIYAEGLEVAGRYPTARPTILAAGYPLLDRNLLGDALLEQSARMAWDVLRSHRMNTAALAVVAEHCYRRGRLPLASRIVQRLLSSQPRVEIERSFALRLWSMVRADPAFLRALPQVAGTPPGIPPLGLRGPLPREGTPILLSGDAAYWQRFGPDLVSSIGTACTQPLVHAHIIDSTPESRALLTQLSGLVPLCVTEESTDWLEGVSTAERKTYYACARFLHLPALLDAYARPVAALDMDCVVVGDVTALPMGQVDVGMLRDFNRPGPTREYNAAFFHIAPTQHGRAVASALSAYIADFVARRQLYWMLDQAALGVVTSEMVRTTPTLRVLWHDLHAFALARYIAK